MHIQNLTLYQFPQKQPLNLNHRFILSQSCHIKLVTDNSLRIGQETKIQADQVISIGSDCLSRIHSSVERVL